MRKFFLLLVAVGALTAHAATVQYTTDATFDGLTTEQFGDATNNVTFSYNGVSPAPVTTPTNISYGFIQVVTNGSGASFGNIAFDLLVNQSQPGVFGPMQFTGTISAGSITPTSSNAILTFAVTSIDTPDGVRYAITGNPYSVVSPNTLLVQTSIQGNVSDAPTPEPATMGLVGGAFLGISVLLRRRRK